VGGDGDRALPSPAEGRVTGVVVHSSQGRNRGLRERKKAETRRALSAAALRLAGELGPDRVTVEAIAEAAGVSPRTFFNYFSSKDDAIVDVGTEPPSALLTDLQARPDDEAPVEALRAMALAAADRLEATADDVLARFRLAQRYPALAARRTTAMAAVERELAEEIAHRTGLHADRDTLPALAALVALGAVRVGVATWYGRGRTTPLADHVAEAFDLVQAGLRPGPEFRLMRQ
jgi:AcrR family transcriptional regulator